MGPSSLLSTLPTSSLSTPVPRFKAAGRPPAGATAVAGEQPATSPKTLDPALRAKALKTAQDFEQVFLETSLNQVFASADKEGPLGDNGTGGAIYRSMLVNEYARSLAKTGGLGLSKHIMADIIRLQEGHTNGR